MLLSPHKGFRHPVLWLCRAIFCWSSEDLCVAAANVTIMGVQYPLFTHAHYGYGLNDAFDRSVALLIESNEVALTPDSLRQGQTRQQWLLQHSHSKQQAPDQVYTPHNPDVMRNLQPSKADRASSQEAPMSLGSSSRGLKHESEDSRGVVLRTTEPQKAGSRQLQATQEAFLSPQWEGHRAQAGNAAHAANTHSVPEPDEGSETVSALDLIRGSAVVAERHLRAELPVVAHPCLHNGYARPYRRMLADGELPKPATVELVGR